MRLVDLKPRWINGAGRNGLGVSFLCPRCRNIRAQAFFANPIDGGPATELSRSTWQRTGGDFTDLSLLPSLDLSENGLPACSPDDDDPFDKSHWHGWLKNGELTE